MTHTCKTLLPRQVTCPWFQPTANFSSSSSSLCLSTTFFPPSGGSRRMWGEGQKVFLWRNTYLRASIFPTCTWNIRDRLCRWTARSLSLSLFEDASLCLRSREEGNEFYASFFTPASANPRPWSAEISTRFRSDIPSVCRLLSFIYLKDSSLDQYSGIQMFF